jgi:hypothetical protein
MRAWRVLLPAAVVMVAMGLATGFVIMLPWPHEAAASRQCDSAVHTVLATHDEIELQRAAFIVYRLDCSMRRRLPEEPGQ